MNGFGAIIIRKEQFIQPSVQNKLDITLRHQLLKRQTWQTLSYYHKPRPADENYKYTNNEYCNDRLASLFGRCKGLCEIIEDKSNSPLIRYCKGVASGKYKGDDMFGLLLQAVVVKREKEARNIGMQNFKYAHDLVEFAHVIHTHSPKAYDALREFLPQPDPRTLKLHRSHQRRFPIGIQEQTFSLVIQKLNQLQYDGPVALSCDDTELLASLRPYYNQDRKGYFLIGHVGQPLQLLDHEAFQIVVNENNLKKATKLRLWCIQVPLPKIPTIIVAAESIPENLCVEDLLEYLWEIISGFLARGIKISSYAADGSNVERATQHLLEERATSTVRIAIKYPYNGCGAKDFVIKILFFGNQPIATIQDPKHLLKTFQNNLFSGARLLTFPTDVAVFSQVRKIVAAPDLPIYTHDVQKLDRQDDNAATRLFSGATLEWLSKNHPEHLGLIIFLFICGELILRAHFFIELWEKNLEVSKYPKSRHYVSPQCADITRTLIHGFLQVVIIYHDYSGGIWPLLPWLLSTEVIEHVFGLSFHQVVTGCTIFKILRWKGKSEWIQPHIYRCGIDIQGLSTYPTNSDINDIAVCAYGEAELLFALLGVTASDLEAATPDRLPSIRTWFNDYVDQLFQGHDLKSSNDDDSDIGSDTDSDGIDDYQLALDLLEDADDDLPRAQEQRLKGYCYASIALSIEEHTQILSMPELDNDSVDEAFSEDAEQISHVLSKCGNAEANTLPPVNINEPNNPFNAADHQASTSVS
ncbi:hypothetical protein BYT27DRAFT_7250098 [Phlegmacium glaucopus]|nr:hypothetical protein BYT27DRAFT_7250098 [Phlegmacium glaucopus]